MNKNLKTFFLFSAIITIGSVVIINIVLRKIGQDDARFSQSRSVAQEQVFQTQGDVEQLNSRNQGEEELVLVVAEPDPVPVTDGPQMY